MSPERSYRFSRHARNRMRRDDVPEAEVIAAVEDPDYVGSEVRGRANAWKQSATGWLKVTCVIEGATTVIVTVTLKRKGPSDEDNL